MNRHELELELDSQCGNEPDGGRSQFDIVGGPGEAIRLRQLHLLRWTTFILYDVGARPKW